ncbi:sugar ABC transporter permease [Paracoccus sp. S1E-3]|uniref:carbohydrate ABC transporter permease n=1 Tax=Paracoccus sp. S1E-3 TaxID=2756130 RepID=UPI0015EF8C6B|nr:sugar ABC transporter permease [Paracoccus sp. S1E-3]MBA4489369.1 sugar ABC transporter permease [Paracoccus sp. S1E-3]
MPPSFAGRWTPFWLSLPMLLIVALFFYIPVYLSFWWSFTLERPFGGGSEFVGFQNYARVLSDPIFWDAAWRTLVFMVFGSTLAIIVPLILALAADRMVPLSHTARNVLIWPKGIAGASIGVVFAFIFNPFVGIMAPLNGLFPGLWNPGSDGTDAFIMLLIAHVWNGIPFNFVILLAGLQAVPRSLTQAAAIDGASPWRRIRDVQLPMIAPQLFLTFVLEFTESVVSAFALIDTMTQGGPGGATRLLVYKIYQDGFKGYDLSGAATQSAILMVFVLCLAAFQFLYLEKKVRYER